MPEKNDAHAGDKDCFLLELTETPFENASTYGAAGLKDISANLTAKGVRVSNINNRRYLGNKHGLTDFIRSTVDTHCPGIDSMIDIFAGTGTVANTFIDKTVIVNDLLYSNYLSALCWFSPTNYRPDLIIRFIEHLNAIHTDEDNYVRQNFADTYFAADDCSKIGVARELIEQAKTHDIVNEREYAILVTAVLYGMDRIANTVGHYDAYRKNAQFERPLVFPVLLPTVNLPADNQILNGDANHIIKGLKADLLYCDPPYNSRQYSDAYHLLENIARWEKPEVHGAARKMDRTHIKSDYNTVRAADALRDLISKADVKYIVFSYNNMATKGNGRSNAKISDAEIMEILSDKGEVLIFEKSHKSFSTGKSDIQGNTERLFVCKVGPTSAPPKAIVISPLNYIGGKGKLLPQILPLLPPSELFVDLFAGGCNVGVNAPSDRVIFNDTNKELVDLLDFLSNSDPKRVTEEIDSLAMKYGLSNTYSHHYADYRTTSSAGLGKYNRDAYMRLREDYNRTTDPVAKQLQLYALVIFGFNNQIRFNKSGEFNLPVGKRDFNARMRKKLTTFHERMSELTYEFFTQDFRAFDVPSTPQDTVFYCDPPYLITQATYNERGGWSVSDEEALLSFLDGVHSSGRKFALSNVLKAKGVTNALLEKWSENPDYHVHYLKMSYDNSNYRRAARGSDTIEVLITNYP